MLVGYMRVSTTDDRQTVDLQRDALVATGVDHRHLHTDKASGARDDRPGLKACLDYLNAGDTLIVWKLDRLARSVRQLVDTAEDLAKREIGLKVRTLAAAPADDRHRSEGARHRVPVADRADGYDHAARRIAVLAVRCIGTI